MSQHPHSPHIPTFAVATLGCKVNQADSEAISEQMHAAGYVQRDFSESADVYIVNTCTVTHFGDRSSRHLIAQAQRRSPNALLVVTGCYAELNPKAVAALPGVDVVVGNSSKDALLDAIKQHTTSVGTGVDERRGGDPCGRPSVGTGVDEWRSGDPCGRPSSSATEDISIEMHIGTVDPHDRPSSQKRALHLLDAQHIGSDETLPFQIAEADPQPDNPSPLLSDGSDTSALANSKFTSRTRVQMKVQDGCDNRCTYCIVPYVRGGSRSRSIASVVEHVQRKVRAGFQEVVLTGIHLGDYHPQGDEQSDLGDLIAALLHQTEIPRIRVSSLEPEDFRLEWLAHWENPRMCRHLHLPMQSGSDAILRRMARRYNSTRYSTIVTEAKRLVPGIAISTDIITGFPGESDADFELTYQLAEELQFAKTHIFRFSPRQGTPAARMKGQVKDQIKKDRSERLLALNDVHSRHFREQFLGQTVQVLVERPRHERWEGLSDNYLRVELHNLPPRSESWQHSLVNAHLTHLIDDGIYGVYVP